MSVRIKNSLMNRLIFLIKYRPEELLINFFFEQDCADRGHEWSAGEDAQMAGDWEVVQLLHHQQPGIQLFGHADEGRELDVVQYLRLVWYLQFNFLDVNLCSHALPSFFFFVSLFFSFLMNTRQCISGFDVFYKVLWWFSVWGFRFTLLCQFPILLFCSFHHFVHAQFKFDSFTSGLHI